MCSSQEMRDRVAALRKNVRTHSRLVIEQGTFVRVGWRRVHAWTEVNEHAVVAIATAQPDPNARSIVLRLEHGRCRWLLTGDMDAAGQRRLAASSSQLRCELLKVPHHGSDRSLDPVCVTGEVEIWTGHTSAQLEQMRAALARLNEEGAATILE